MTIQGDALSGAAEPDFALAESIWEPVYRSRDAQEGPLAFREGLLAKAPRHLAALRAAAKAAGWGKPPPKGRARGLAVHESFGSIAAGLALGVLALRTGSFWYGAGLHATIAVFMDLLAGLPRLKGT